jgi:YHS domain-containing protein
LSAAEQVESKNIQTSRFSRIIRIKTMKFIFAFFLTITVFLINAQEAAIYQNRSGAIQGYDAVSYFQNEGPKAGNEAFRYAWNGATWYFASQENLDLFKASPEKYAPQFGGYCAYAVAHGYTAKSDPLAWKRVEGKLYLNYNKQVQARWEQNQEEFIQSGEENWPRLHE